MNDRILVAVVTYNEGEKLQQLLGQFPLERLVDLIVVDDGSADYTPDVLRSAQIRFIRHDVNQGVGAAIRTAIRYAQQNDYGVIVIMAGNGKMLPSEINRLTEPILSNRADYVQGSRYVKGGQSPNLPLFRRVAIRLLTTIINLLVGFRGTDITCGFRAYRLELATLPEVNLDQEWLNRYEMEYYLHYKAIKNGFRIAEAPVTMLYPETGKNYSKIRPIIDWWSMLRPWLFLVLRLRK